MNSSEISVPSANVLIVDDHAFSRKTLKLAVENLGCKVQTAKSGVEAIERVRSDEFHAILLDMLMPAMDGFDVLFVLKNDEDLREIPVIVISSLEDDSQSVSKAIALGAEDFLPKEFDPIILNARLKASLQKKQFRDQELEYFGRINTLTDAAEKVEGGLFDADSLKLSEVSLIPDPIGRLAAVFEGMASEIYQRELKLTRRIQALQGILLVIVNGMIWGLIPALSRMSSGLGSNPIGLAIYVNLVAAVFCLSVAAMRQKITRLTPGEWLFFLTWAFLTGALQRITIFVLTEHVQATLLSLIVALQGFIVFAIAAFLRLERANLKRVFGFSIGLVGIAGVLLQQVETSGSTKIFWLAAALILPLLLAIESIALADKRPKHIDHFTSVGFMFGLSMVFVVPLAVIFDDVMPLDLIQLPQFIVIVLLGLAAALANVTIFILIATAGAVFASQAAYSMTLAGIVWGMLLLGEQVQAMAWFAIALVLVGMYLVEPTPSDKDIVIKRDF